MPHTAVCHSVTNTAPLIFTAANLYCPNKGRHRTIATKVNGFTPQKQADLQLGNLNLYELFRTKFLFIIFNIKSYTNTLLKPVMKNKWNGFSHEAIH